MLADCCRRFADLDAYLTEVGSIDLGAASKTRDGGACTVTARGVLLTRDGTVQHCSEEVYGEQGWQLAPWHHDTYFGGLGVDAATMRRFAAGRILDLGAGLGLFATEASVLGLEVDCADLEMVDDHPAFELATSWFRRHYADQIELLHCLSSHRGHPRYDLGEHAAPLLARLYEARADVARHYPKPSGRRFVADARSLTGVADQTYDLVLSGWLTVHLEEQDERRVLESAVRVTRSGGEVRIKAGYGADAVGTFRRGYPGGVVAGRTVSATAASRDDLLVLAVD